MYFAITALQRKGRPLQYLRGLSASWLGNLVGALLTAALFTYCTESLSSEPFRSRVLERVSEEIIEPAWHVVFLRAIGCGYMVTFAMYLGTQNHDGISKALALHLPFFVSTTVGFPHTVEQMYVSSTGMMLGSPLSVGAYLWKALLPISLGNAVGGAVFTGGYLWWVFFYCHDEEKTKDRFAEWEEEREQDGA